MALLLLFSEFEKGFEEDAICEYIGKRLYPLGGELFILIRAPSK